MPLRVRLCSTERMQRIARTNHFEQHCSSQAMLDRSVVILEAETKDYTQYVILTASPSHSIGHLSKKGAYVIHNPEFYIGSRRYAQVFFVLCDRATASDFVLNEHGSDLEQMLMRFNNLTVYSDVELIALASLCTAGNVVNKLLHLPLSHMRVARVYDHNHKSMLACTGSSSKTT